MKAGKSGGFFLTLLVLSLGSLFLENTRADVIPPNGPIDTGGTVTLVISGGIVSVIAIVSILLLRRIRSSRKNVGK